MKVDVAKHVAKCLTCQQVKAQHCKSGGMLQPLEIPEWKWEHIVMDFVMGLPRSQMGHDSIWGIVDRLTKSAHFLPMQKDFALNKYAEIYVRQIVRLHGVPVTITSDRDPKFTAAFWKSLHTALGTKLQFSTAYHPQTDGQSERTIQTLEDMLRACVLDFKGSWEEQLHLVEFAYNNSFQQSIGMAPFEALYGRACRTPVCWDEVGERSITGPELVQQSNETVRIIRDRLKTAQSRQKSYADWRCRPLEFQVGDHVFLKVSPTRGLSRFGKKGKLSPRYVGPFEVLERIGILAYRLALPPSLSHVHNVFHVSMLRRYEPDPTHVLNYEAIDVDDRVSYVEKPIRIEDRMERVLRNKTIPMVKVIWEHHGTEGATWESEELMRHQYPHLFG